jgi:hypothetical protein
VESGERRAESGGRRAEGRGQRAERRREGEKRYLGELHLILEKRTNIADSIPHPTSYIPNPKS